MYSIPCRVLGLHARAYSAIDPQSVVHGFVQRALRDRSGCRFFGFSLGDVRGLRGPRRVGKSTALKKLVARRLGAGTPARNILHISVEGRTAQDVVDIVRRPSANWLGGAPGERLWVIDEITGVDGPWPENIKRLRDSEPHFSADTVILTGSSAARFEEARKQLAGRRNADRSDRSLFQMGFVDVCRALGVELPKSPRLTSADLADKEIVAEAVSQMRPWLSTLVDTWDRYLQMGGYPQAVDPDDPSIDHLVPELALLGAGIGQLHKCSIRNG